MAKINRLPADLPVDGRAAPAKALPPPDTRMLTEIEQAQARAFLLEKQLMDARKATLLARQEIIAQEKQLVALREENLRLQADAHNVVATRADVSRAEWLAGLGVNKDDKADFKDDRLVIQRGGMKA